MGRPGGIGRIPPPAAKSGALADPGRGGARHESVTRDRYVVLPVNPASAAMGYRELLKNYIRHLELVAGDNYIEQETSEPVLSKRDLGELRTLAAEIHRDAYRAVEVGRVDNYNYRLRVLMNRHALDAEQVAALSGVPKAVVRRWRTNPASERYLPMTEADFTAFELALNHWLETSDG